MKCDIRQTREGVADGGLSRTISATGSSTRH